MSDDKFAIIKKLAFTAHSSDDKFVRKQSYIKLEAMLRSQSDCTFNADEIRAIFNDSHIYFMSGLRDRAEPVREQTIKFLSYLLIERLPLNDFYLTYLFPILVERLGTVEVIEESEEVRLQLLQLIEQLLSYYGKSVELKPFLNDCIVILAETVLDPYPTIKELSLKLIRILSEAIPDDFHLQAESLIKPVLTCFNHQRYRVRIEAIKAVSVIIMNSSYQGLDLVIVPMAQKLFDQIPAVRRVVAQVAAVWLKEYRDRYSFFHKILPLLLTGLNDEIDETRIEANELWEQVGLQYLKENERDLKEQIDFLIDKPEYYPEKLKRPNLGCRILVQRNIGKLAHALTNELTSWQPDIRFRCSQLLCSITLHAEDGLTMHLQELLPAMYSAARDEDQRVSINIVEASKLLGLFVSIETWSKLVLPFIEDCPHFGHLSVLNGLICGTPLINTNNLKWFRQITVILADDSICYSRNRKYQIEMAKCVQALSLHCPDDNDIKYDLFKITVGLIALNDPQSSMNLVKNDDLTIIINSLDCNYKTNDLLRLLNELFESQPESWTIYTPQRCVFETILLQSHEIFTNANLNIIADILVKTLDANCNTDAESRLKTFSALSEAFDDDTNKMTISSDSDLSRFFQTLINDIFVPSLIWSAGLTAEVMRTMSAACLKSVLSDAKLFIDKTTSTTALKPLLLSLLEDASSRSRVLAIECLVELKRIEWSIDDLISVYPEVIKRLDDPTNQVRLTALKCLPDILRDCPREFHQSHYKAHHELLIDTLLVHFDDDDTHVQKLVLDCLFVVAAINTKELSQKLERCKDILRNQQGLGTVEDYLRKLEINNN